MSMNVICICEHENFNSSIIWLQELCKIPEGTSCPVYTLSNDFNCVTCSFMKDKILESVKILERSLHCNALLPPILPFLIICLFQASMCGTFSPKIRMGLEATKAPLSPKRRVEPLCILFPLSLIVENVQYVNGWVLVKHHMCTNLGIPYISKLFMMFHQPTSGS